MNRIGFLIFLFMFVFRLYSLEELQVHLQSSFMPTANSYDFVKGDSTGLLHFYTAEIETDSVWISVFTCDSEGNYSEKISINSLLYPTVSGSEGTLINMEFKYNKLYTHVLHDSTLLVLINHSDGNVDNHIINTIGQLFYSNTNILYYHLFNETTILSAYYNKVYKTDLLTNQVFVLYDYNSWCFFSQFNFDDDYIFFISRRGEDFFIDNQLNQYPLSDEFCHWIYKPIAKIGDNKYLTIMISDIPGLCNYKLLFLEDGVINEYDIIPDIYEYEVSYTDKYPVSINNFSYIGIRNIIDVNTGSVYFESFAKYNIINNQLEYSPSFPNLEYLSDPISLHRINDQAIIALSGDSNGPINFTIVDLEREQLYTQSFNVGLINEYNYSIIPAGEYFYMFKENVIYSFKLETVLNNDINDTPELIQLSCYPNPFKDQLKIKSSDQYITNTSLNVFDIKGKKIKTLLKDQKLEKNNEIIWDACNDQGHKVPSGVYFLKFDNEKNHQIKKILLIK